MRMDGRAGAGMEAGARTELGARTGAAERDRSVRHSVPAGQALGFKQPLSAMFPGKMYLLNCRILKCDRGHEEVGLAFLGCGIT